MAAFIKGRKNSPARRIPDFPAILIFTKPSAAPSWRRIKTARICRQFCAAHPDAIVVANEVGAGVVPIVKEDRLFREAVGRALCIVAQESESVTRCVCGIGVRIK